MSGFKDTNNRQIEKNNAALGKQPKRFDLGRHQATLADASLSGLRLRDETLTPVERIQLHSERNEINLRQLVQKSRMYKNAWDKWQGTTYGTEEWDDCAQPQGSQAETSSQHAQGDQAEASSHYEAPQTRYSNQQEYTPRDQWQGNIYGTDNSAQLQGSQAETLSQHAQGDQAELRIELKDSLSNLMQLQKAKKEDYEEFLNNCNHSEAMQCLRYLDTQKCGDFNLERSNFGNRKTALAYYVNAKWNN